MTVTTITCGKDDRINLELEKASTEAQPVKLVTASGQVLIAFPAEGFDRMCDVIQSPEFTQSLSKGLGEYGRGEGKLYRKGERPR